MPNDEHRTLLSLCLPAQQLSELSAMSVEQVIRRQRRFELMHPHDKVIFGAVRVTGSHHGGPAASDETAHSVFGARLQSGVFDVLMADRDELGPLALEPS